MNIKASKNNKFLSRKAIGEWEMRGFYIRKTNGQRNYFLSSLVGIIISLIMIHAIGIASQLFFGILGFYLTYSLGLLFSLYVFCKFFVISNLSETKRFYGRNQTEFKPIRIMKESGIDFGYKVENFKNGNLKNIFPQILGSSFWFLFYIFFLYNHIQVMKEEWGTQALSKFIFLDLGALLLFVFMGYLIVHLIERFHPLYAFGNLGEKIQFLTPQIEEKSQEIQKNFQTYMNFQVLSTGFDSLSSTFSQIVSLVIKLEQVEKRANKGNLFDSVKYINSLRSDIVEPLKSLKSFLEKQREKLLESQKELQRVRVGGALDSGTSPEGQGHGELASKRSEPFIAELTENIEKLDEMIGKMG